MKKVLIIEDDPVVAHIYKTRLEKEDYQVDVAGDGQSGFYRVHEFKPDAVLLDLMLPKLNGVEMLRKLRSEPEIGKVPVVVFTNAYVPNMINDAFAAGANQVFNKSTLTPRQILDAIHNVISYAANPLGSESGNPADNPGSSPATGVRRRTGETTFRSSPDSVGVPGGAGSGDSGDPFSPSDAEFQAGLQRSFRDSASEMMIHLRRLLQAFCKADEPNRMPHLLELFRKVHALTSNAGIAGLPNIARLSAALEVLLKELHDKPDNLNASSVRTVAYAVDFLADLFAKAAEGDLIACRPVEVLAVDDETLSRRAVSYALERAELGCVSVEDPQLALQYLEQKPYDLVLLDVQMPGIDGFELCTKLRAIPHNSATPVIFVTSLTDFISRARSSLSGGNDFIAKPFMFIELSVKVLAYVMRHRLASGNSGLLAA